jgi:hypothetical protein
LVELDGMQLSTIRESASTTSTTRYVCLPDWALGAAHDLTLRAFATNMLIDNVEVDHDERCGDNSFDRGFERPLEAGGWFIHSSGGPDAKVVSDSRAFAGHGSLSVQNTLLGAAMRFPETASGAHAALSWAARVGTSQMSGSVSPRGVAPALNTTIPTSSPTWAITTVCAGHIWDGQLAQLIVSASASLGSGATGTPEILLDEFGPSSSSGCP